MPTQQRRHGLNHHLRLIMGHTRSLALHMWPRTSHAPVTRAATVWNDLMVRGARCSACTPTSVRYLQKRARCLVSRRMDTLSGLGGALRDGSSSARAQAVFPVATQALVTKHTHKIEDVQHAAVRGLQARARRQRLESIRFAP